MTKEKLTPPSQAEIDRVAAEIGEEFKIPMQLWIAPRVDQLLGQAIAIVEKREAELIKAKLDAPEYKARFVSALVIALAIETKTWEDK